jgi:hypothetical protein
MSVAVAAEVAVAVAVAAGDPPQAVNETTRRQMSAVVKVKGVRARIEDSSKK